MIRVIFLRNVNDSPGPVVGRRPAVSVTPSWEEVGSSTIDPMLLPRTGDYIHVPLDNNLTAGTTVLGISWQYAEDAVFGGLKVVCVEIKIQ